MKSLHYYYYYIFFLQILCEEETTSRWVKLTEYWTYGNIKSKWRTIFDKELLKVSFLNSRKYCSSGKHASHSHPFP